MTDIASSQAIFGKMVYQPSNIWYADELGKLLATVNSPKASPHMAGVTKILLEFFSKAGSAVSKPYAKHEDCLSIVNPCLNVLGAATPETLFASLTEESINDGLIPRFMFFVGQDKPDDEEEELRRIEESFGKSPDELPQELVDSAKRLQRSLIDTSPKEWLPGELAAPSGDDDGLPPGSVEPEVMRFGGFEAWRSRAAKYQITCRNRGGIWTRALEKSLRLALVRAVSRNAHEGLREQIITLDDFLWAVNLVDWNTRLMIQICESNLSQGGWADTKAKILGFVAANKHQNDGLGVKKREITRKFRGLKGKQINDALAELVESEEIVAAQAKKTGRGKRPLHYTPRCGC